MLYGLNTATYKIALARSLLLLTNDGNTTVPWSRLSQVFLEQYLKRLEENPGRPQTSLPHRRTKMERIVAEHRLGKLDFGAAVDRVGNEAFGDVIRRFHNLGKEDWLKGSFYEADFGKSLSLTDAMFAIGEDAADLEEEIEARWSLLEGAYSIHAHGYSLANDIRDIYLVDGYERTDITNTIPFLQGYQGNQCFYCTESLDGKIHVDHVLPRQVLQNDEIWNLVLSHEFCNLQKQDRLVGPHFIRKLIARNENVMGSNHPWKKKIGAALGNTPAARIKKTKAHYENVSSVLGWNYWGGEKGYSPESDPFFRRLITVINNKDLQ